MVCEKPGPFKTVSKQTQIKLRFIGASETSCPQPRLPEFSPETGASSGGLVPQLVSRRSSAEAHRLSHDTGHLCQKSGVSDRHGRSLWAGQSFNLGTELLRERLDDARAEPGFWLSKDAVRLANPIVSDRKLPICSGNFLRNGDLPIFCIFAECVL